MMFGQSMWLIYCHTMFLGNLQLSGHGSVIAMQSLTVVKTILFGAHLVSELLC
jgi:hypothetical protein